MNKKNTSDKKTHISFPIHRETAERLAIIAKKQDRSLSSLLRRIVEKYMADGGENE